MNSVHVPVSASATLVDSIAAAFRGRDTLVGQPDLAAWAAAIEWLLGAGRIEEAEFAARYLHGELPSATYPKTLCEVFDELPPDDGSRYESDGRGVQVFARKGASTALLIFCGIENTVGMKVPLVHRWFGRLPASLIYLRDTLRNYYLGGIPELGGDRASTVAKLREMIASLGATRIACYGNSMGGYAALRYGLELEANAVLALGAPTRLAFATDEGRLRRAAAPGSPADPGERALDLRQLFLKAERRPKAWLAFGAAHWDDRLDAERMAGVPGVELEAIAGVASHSILPDLIRQRRFQPLLRWLVEGETDSGADHPSTASGERRTGRDEPPGPRVYGRFRTDAAVGRWARNLVLALQSAGVPATAHEIGETEAESDAEAGDAARLRLYCLPPQLLHDNPAWLLGGASAATRRIGYWSWELPVFPARLARVLDHVDEIWVPSTFVARTMASASERPVHVVPGICVPEATPAREARKSLALPENSFIFLTVFDPNSYPERRNPLATIRAFLDAFPPTPSSDVMLVVKSRGKGASGSVSSEIERLSRDPRIRLLDAAYPVGKMRTLQAACDAFVSLHRSEGFGLTLLQSMALGKPCVATGFSGNLDYMSQKNSLLVPYRMRRVQRHEYPFGEGQWWAEPVHDAAVAAMRDAVRGTASVRAMAESAKSETLVNFSPEAVGARAAAILRGEGAPFVP